MAALAAGFAASLAAWPAQAQQPSKAELDAVRSNCRSDYMSKCMSVKPGGIEAMQCLKKNEASLSAACRSAVSAVKLPGETPAATAAPAPASPPPPPAVAAPAPVPAPAATATKPAEPAPAVATPSKPVPPKPAQAKPAAAPKPAMAATPPAAAPVTTPPPATTTPQAPTLQEAQLVRRFCTVDYQVLCKGVRLGGGRVIKCLSANQPALSPNCKAALAKAQ
jgi:hypothetical protein